MRRLLIGLVGALALVVVPLGAAETSYSDPAGDSGPAPDITTVAVSNIEDGTTTFRVNIGNYTTLPQYPAALVGMGLFLDLDKNSSTGDDGDEGYAFFDSTGAVAFERWNGTELADVPASNMSSSFSNGVLSFTIARSELMNTSGFTFSWVTLYIPGGGGVVSADRAPNVGMADWSYDLVLPPPVVVKPVIGTPAAAPAAPVAGKRFTVSFKITRSDNGAPLTSATIGCTTKIAGKVVPHKHTFANGTVKATLLVPKGAKGKQLKVAVNVTAEGQAATKVLTFTVR